jgi:hypothetical protein
LAEFCFQERTKVVENSYDHRPFEQVAIVRAGLAGADGAFPRFPRRGTPQPSRLCSLYRTIQKWAQSAAMSMRKGVR